MKRELDQFEKERLAEELDKLKQVKSDWFRFEDEEEVDPTTKTLESNSDLFVWDSSIAKWVLKWDPLCRSLAAKFYKSTKYTSYPNRALLEYQDYLQEARYKIVHLVAHKVPEPQYEKAVENHLRDYRRSHNKAIKEEAVNEDG